MRPDYNNNNWSAGSISWRQRAECRHRERGPPHSSPARRRGSTVSERDLSHTGVLRTLSYRGLTSARCPPSCRVPVTVTVPPHRILKDLRPAPDQQPPIGFLDVNREVIIIIIIHRSFYWPEGLRFHTDLSLCLPLAFSRRIQI